MDSVRQTGAMQYIAELKIICCRRTSATSRSRSNRWRPASGKRARQWFATRSPIASSRKQLRVGPDAFVWTGLGAIPSFYNRKWRAAIGGSLARRCSSARTCRAGSPRSAKQRACESRRMSRSGCAGYDGEYRWHGHPVRVARRRPDARLRDRRSRPAQTPKSNVPSCSVARAARADAEQANRLRGSWPRSSSITTSATMLLWSASCARRRRRGRAHERTRCHPSQCDGPSAPGFGPPRRRARNKWKTTPPISWPHGDQPNRDGCLDGRAASRTRKSRSTFTSTSRRTWRRFTAMRHACVEVLDHLLSNAIKFTEPVDE